MCLYKDKKHHPFNRPLVAKEDIVCYKQLHFNCVNILVTPCTETHIPKKCIQKNKRKRNPFKAEITNKFKFIWRHVLGFSNVVEDGFIHIFSSLPPLHNFRWYDCVFKCIIPKGTKYFIGKYGDYASEQIIFVEQLV